MATTPTLRQRPLRATHRPVLAFWHLLSLDAPTVAALWTWFIARASHVRLPWASLAAMFLAVWILYVADRLLDARLLNSAPLADRQELEPRHHFHHRHRAAFLTGIMLVSAALTPLLVKLPAESLRLYLTEASLLIAWFLVIHITQSAYRLPKELAVGPFFAAAVFIPTVSRVPALRPALLAPAILFSALCSLNCLYIYAWEHPSEAQRAKAHATTAFALGRLPALTAGLVAASLLLTALTRSPIPLACMLSTAILFALHANRNRMQPTTLRAAADLALLTPLLVLALPVSS